MRKTAQTKSTNANESNKKVENVVFKTFTEILKSAAPDININKIMETMELMQTISPFLDDIKKIIETHPTFINMPLNEIVETKDFEEIFREVYETKYKDTVGIKEAELFKNMLPRDFFLLVQNYTTNQLQKKKNPYLHSVAKFH